MTGKEKLDKTVELTLDKAIRHVKEASMRMCSRKDTCNCGIEHLQLAKWLEELKLYRNQYPRIETNDIAYERHRL